MMKSPPRLSTTSLLSITTTNSLSTTTKKRLQRHQAGTFKDIEASDNHLS